jgi:hypothetical protein
MLIKLRGRNEQSTDRRKKYKTWYVNLKVTYISVEPTVPPLTLKDGGSKLLRNIDIILPDYTAFDSETK